MPEPICPRDEFWEGSDPAWTLAQIPRKDGLSLKQANVDGVVLTVFDTQTRVEIYRVDIPPTSVIFDSPVLTPYWTEDTIGFTFAHYLDNALVFASQPEQDGKMYRMEYELDCNDGSGIIVVAREILCRARYSV